MKRICWACFLGWNVPLWMAVSFICWATYPLFGVAVVFWVLLGTALTKIPRWPHGTP